MTGELVLGLKACTKNITHTHTYIYIYIYTCLPFRPNNKSKKNMLNKRCDVASVRAPGFKGSYLGASTIRIGLARIIASGAWLLWRQILETLRVGCIPVRRRVDGNTGTAKDVLDVTCRVPIPTPIARHPCTSLSTSACLRGPHIRVLFTCHPLTDIKLIPFFVVQASTHLKVRHFSGVPRAQRLVKGRGLIKHVLNVTRRVAPFQFPSPAIHSHHYLRQHVCMDHHTYAFSACAIPSYIKPIPFTYIKPMPFFKKFVNTRTHNKVRRFCGVPRAQRLVKGRGLLKHALDGTRRVTPSPFPSPAIHPHHYLRQHVYMDHHTYAFSARAIPLHISNSYPYSNTRALTEKVVTFPASHEPNGWLKAVAPSNMYWMSHAGSRHTRYHRPPSIHIIFHVSMSAWTTHTRSPHVPSLTYIKLIPFFVYTCTHLKVRRFFGVPRAQRLVEGRGIPKHLLDVTRRVAPSPLPSPAIHPHHYPRQHVCMDHTYPFSAHAISSYISNLYPCSYTRVLTLKFVTFSVFQQPRSSLKPVHP